MACAHGGGDRGELEGVREGEGRVREVAGGGGGIQNVATAR